MMIAMKKTEVEVVGGELKRDKCDFFACGSRDTSLGFGSDFSCLSE